MEGLKPLDRNNHEFEKPIRVYLKHFRQFRPVMIGSKEENKHGTLRAQCWVRGVIFP